MTQEIGEEINELLQEIAGVHALQERMPGDVDAEMMEAITGYSLKYCEELLREKVKAGELLKIYVRGTDGKRKTVFRKVTSQ